MERKKGVCEIGDLQVIGEDSNDHIDKIFHDTGNLKRRLYREHGKEYEKGAENLVELSGEDKKLLDCYHRLGEEDREYIWCKMIVLERETMD